jgi:hypothetical protein
MTFRFLSLSLRERLGEGAWIMQTLPSALIPLRSKLSIQSFLLPRSTP